MSGTELAAIVAVVAGYASSVAFIVGRLDRRLERIEDRLAALDLTLARVGQRLVDHVDHHPEVTR